MNEPKAFTVEQVQRLTGLSERQIRYWDKTGFFSPRYVSEDRRRPYSRIYSFRDVVGLRTIALLRNVHGIPLQELRKLGEWLAKRYASPWASLTFYVSGKQVFFEWPDAAGRVVARPPGQLVLPIEMERIAQEVIDTAQQLRQRAPAQIGQVSRHRFVVHNSPVVAGTRILTEAIWNFHQAGYNTDAIIREYPQLIPEDVRGAVAFEEQKAEKLAG